MLNNKQIKINVSNETEYRQITTLMDETNFKWHIYKNKATRPIKVMIILHISFQTKFKPEEAPGYDLITGEIYNNCLERV